MSVRIWCCSSVTARENHEKQPSQTWSPFSYKMTEAIRRNWKGSSLVKRWIFVLQLEKQRSPLLKDLMLCLKEIMKDYRTEVQGTRTNVNAVLFRKISSFPNWMLVYLLRRVVSRQTVGKRDRIRFKKVWRRAERTGETTTGESKKCITC